MLRPCNSHRHLHFDRLVRIVPDHFEIRKLKAVNVRLFWIDFQFWKRARLSFQLFFQSVDVVEVDVCVSNRMDEIAGLASSYMSYHPC